MGKICFLMLVSMSAAARLKGVVVPDLLLDIYRTDMVTRCKLRNVASVLPATVSTGKT